MEKRDEPGKTVLIRLTQGSAQNLNKPCFFWPPKKFDGLLVSSIGSREDKSVGNAYKCLHSEDKAA